MKKWKQFEMAVARFVAALDPSATVTHNVRLPDRDTGHPRQRDVWIDATICKIFRINILVSCKQLRRKVNEQDMDAFVGELASSGAHLGVLFVKTGYTKPALEKARILRIVCCKLYEDQPPELPDVLTIPFYCANSSFNLGANDEAIEIIGDKKIEDILSFKDVEDSYFFDRLVHEFWSSQKIAVQESVRLASFPQPWSAGIEMQSTTLGTSSMVLSLHGTWRLFRAKSEAHLLNGSYSFIEEKFYGSQSFPTVDTQASDPGPGWERIQVTPARMDSPMGLIVLKGGDVRGAILERHTGKKLRELV